MGLIPRRRGRRMTVRELLWLVVALIVLAGVASALIDRLPG